MYILSFIILIALVSGTLISSAPKDNSTAINVKVTNIEHPEGHVKLVLFDQSNFLTNKYVTCIKISANQSLGEVQTIFKNITPGDYAIAIYQDLNDNNWFDRNWVGYPKEPFAMSNNLRPISLLYPDFEDAKVHVTVGDTIKINIKLLNN